MALGSGSYHGHALIGVMRAFEEHKLRPHLIVGTSVGAMVGALWAAGLDSREVESAASRFSLWKDTTLSWTKRGLFRNDGLEETIRKLTHGRPIEEWPIRFAAVASDLATGKRVVIDRGDAGVAVAASACLPVFNSPVRWNGRLLVDGALTEPVPAKVARELGGERVVAVDIAYRPRDAPVTSLTDTAFQVVQILVNGLIAEQIEEADVKIRLSLHRLMEGRKDYSAILLAAGKTGAEAAWQEIAGKP